MHKNGEKTKIIFRARQFRFPDRLTTTAREKFMTPPRTCKEYIIGSMWAPRRASSILLLY